MLKEAADGFRGCPDSPDRILELHFGTLEFSRPVFELIGFMRIDPVIGVRASQYFFIAHELPPYNNLQWDAPIAELLKKIILWQLPSEFLSYDLVAWT